MDKSDFAKRLADKLIEQLKDGTAPWTAALGGGPDIKPIQSDDGEPLSRGERDGVNRRPAATIRVGWPIRLQG